MHAFMPFRRSGNRLSSSICRALLLTIRNGTGPVQRQTPLTTCTFTADTHHSKFINSSFNYQRRVTMATAANGYSTIAQEQSCEVSSAQEVQKALTVDAVDGSDEDIVRKTVTVSALDTTFDVVFREWWNLQEEGAEDYPSVVCIHGAPATDSTFRTVGGPIAAKGYRVIAVNNPGMGYTELDPGHKYDHSPFHKAEVVKGLIRALKLKKIAMIIGHSMGGHVAGMVAADPEMEGIIESVCFLCGPGTRPHRTHKSAHPTNFLPGLIYRTMYIPILGWFIIAFFSRLVTKLGLRGKTPQAQVLSIYEVHQLDFNAFSKVIHSIAESQMPVLLLYANDDRIIEGKIAEENMEVLGLKKEEAVYYDEDGKTEDSFKEDSVRRAVCFATGSHRVAIKRPQLVSKEMTSFLEALSNHLQSADK